MTFPVHIRKQCIPSSFCQKTFPCTFCASHFSHISRKTRFPRESRFTARIAATDIYRYYLFRSPFFFPLSRPPVSPCLFLPLFLCIIASPPVHHRAMLVTFGNKFHMGAFLREGRLSISGSVSAVYFLSGLLHRTAYAYAHFARRAGGPALASCAVSEHVPDGGSGEHPGVRPERRQDGQAHSPLSSTVGCVNPCAQVRQVRARAC